MHPVVIASPTALALMEAALAEAQDAVHHGDVPVGAVVARSNGCGEYEIVARAHNRREVDQDPSAHAEVLALRAASGVLGSWRLNDCVLVVTLEPCVMCAGAISAARIQAVVFGAADPKAGSCGSLYSIGSDPRLNHSFGVLGGVAAERSSALLSDFFAKRRPSRPE